jgi:integrase
MTIERSELAVIEVNRSIDTVGANEKVEALAKSVTKLLEHEQSDNTKSTYESYWKSWEEHCASIGARPIPADPITAAAWIAALVEKKRTISTIRVALAAVKHGHLRAGYESPTLDPLVRSTLRGAIRSHGAPKKRKKGISIAQLRAILAKIDRTNIVGARDHALLALGWFGAMRRSELCSLHWKDIDFSSEEGVSITIARSKTDQGGRGITKGIPYHSEPALCPVRSVKRWERFCLAQGRGPDDFVFAGIDKVGRIRKEALHGGSVAKIVKNRCEKAGIDPKFVSGHSLRRGFATEAVRQGKRLEQVQRHLAHASITTTSGYVDEATRFDDSNPARGLI